LEPPAIFQTAVKREPLPPHKKEILETSKDGFRTGLGILGLG